MHFNVMLKTENNTENQGVERYLEMLKLKVGLFYWGLDNAFSDVDIHPIRLINTKNGEAKNDGFEIDANIIDAETLFHVAFSEFRRRASLAGVAFLTILSFAGFNHAKALELKNEKPVVNWMNNVKIRTESPVIADTEIDNKLLGVNNNLLLAMGHNNTVGPHTNTHSNHSNASHTNNHTNSPGTPSHTNSHTDHNNATHSNTAHTNNTVPGHTNDHTDHSNAGHTNTAHTNNTNPGHSNDHTDHANSGHTNSGHSDHSNVGHNNTHNDVTQTVHTNNPVDHSNATHSDTVPWSNFDARHTNNLWGNVTHHNTGLHTNVVMDSVEGDYIY